MFSVNLTLNICGFLVMLIVLYSIFFEATEKSVRIYLLRAIVLTVVAGIFIDSASQLLLLYKPDEKITFVIKLISFLPSNIWVCLLIYYFTCFLREKNVGSWKVSQFVTIYLAINCIIIIISGITNNLFTIQNSVLFSNYKGSIPIVMLLLACILYFSLLVKYRHALGNHLFMALLFNMIIPFAAFIIDCCIPTYDTQYFAESISVVISCVMIQHQEIREKNIILQVTNSELEDHITQIIALNHSLNEQMNIIHSMGKIYFATYYIDLENDSFEELSSKNSIRSTIGSTGPAQESLNLISELLVEPEFSEKMRNFINLSTLNERLANKDFVTYEYISATSGWSQMYIIAGDRNDDGNLRHVFISSRIIHEEKARELEQNKVLEEALETAKAANSAKTAFLSRMSHDIRTPLNGIIGLLEINEKHADDRALVDANRVKAKIAANHLLSLISDVLDLTKMDDENVKLANDAFSLLDLAQEVYTIASLRATEAGINIEFLNLKEEIVEEFVFGSPLHIRQILLNVIGNAIKYNKPHGKITYETKCIEHTDTMVTYKITIADTGIGMSQEFLKHLYEPFSQEHSDARSVYQGTGLGMSIVKSLIEKMGGTVSVESEVGVGSKFDLVFPLKIAKKEDVQEKVKADTVDISGVRILLVEDNELNMDIAETILADNGAVVTKAFDGKEAVDIYTENQSGSFDVILMDLMMPVMDGFAATKAIRNSNKRDAKLIPIIAMTANAFSEDVKRCLDAGMNAHVAKPINVQDLFNKIAVVMTR